MLRVVGKVGMMATAMAVFAASSAIAVSPLGTPDSSAIARPSGIGPRTFVGTGFEVSEGYNIGTLSNVNGWDCFGAASTTNVRCGGGVVAKGNGSPQGIMLGENTLATSLTNVGAFSPTFKDFFIPTINVDVRVDDVQGADYFIQTQSPSQTFQFSQIRLRWTGYIYIVDDLDGLGGPLGAAYESVGIFPLDDWFTIEQDIDYANARITYSFGPKDNPWLTYVGNFWTGATQVEEILLFSNNEQETGSGSASDPGVNPPAAYVDNLVLKPEPGTLAMLGIGALIALRRRSR